MDYRFKELIIELALLIMNFLSPVFRPSKKTTTKIIHSDIITFTKKRRRPSGITQDIQIAGNIHNTHIATHLNTAPKRKSLTGK